MKYETLLTDIINSVQIIKMNRPEKLNAWIPLHINWIVNSIVVSIINSIVNSIRNSIEFECRFDRLSECYFD